MMTILDIGMIWTILTMLSFMSEFSARVFGRNVVGVVGE
jgi:hypothetical protein